MILQMYAMYDKQVGTYGAPFFEHTHGAAERSVSDAVNDPQTLISRHSEDHALWHLGEYDNSTGIVTSVTPTQLCVANVLKKTAAQKQNLASLHQ